MYCNSWISFINRKQEESPFKRLETFVNCYEHANSNTKNFLCVCPQRKYFDFPSRLFLILFINKAEEDFLQIVRTGGVAAIVQTIKKEIEYAWIVELGARTLKYICEHYKNESDLQEDKNDPVFVFEEEGGIALMLQAIQLHMQNDLVVESVCCLLSALSRINGGPFF